MGVVAFGFEVAILAMLYQWLQFPLWLASALGAELVLLARFVSTDHFVFGHARPTLGRCCRFHAAAIGSYAVSWIVLNGSASLFDVQYVAAAFLGSVGAFAWSGLTSFFWVWRPASGAASHSPSLALLDAGIEQGASGRVGIRSAQG